MGVGLRLGFGEECSNEHFQRVDQAFGWPVAQNLAQSRQASVDGRVSGSVVASVTDGGTADGQGVEGTVEVALAVAEPGRSG